MDELGETQCRERVRQLEHQALAHLRRRRSNVEEYIAAS